jgi:hypothetical protein
MSFYGRVSRLWTTAEDEQLLERQAQIGSKPSEPRELFPDRTYPDLKNRFHWLNQDNAAMRKQYQTESGSPVFSITGSAESIERWEF